MNARLYQLIYISRNRVARESAAAEAEVMSILALSQRNNARSGVTGALLFNADCFAQVLEGDIGEVHVTFERIQCDPRHWRSVILRAEPIKQRAFGDRSMAYAGRIDHDGIRFDALSGPSIGRSDAADAVMAVLSAAVRRAEFAA